ncbi:MAG: hypothetical protein A2X18_03640 [Bacteroidetes bacterium GWF2_40_14]|nr:MAG: hypothetical protein A2X18_03640 [Bacteroidetes bacterium GWF2_40_14]
MIITNKRYIFIVLPLVILLLGCGIALLFINRNKENPGEERRGVVLKNAVAVPVDAIAIFSFRNSAVLKKAFVDSISIFSHYLNKNNELLRLLLSLDKICSDHPSLKELSGSEILFSVHYSAKNELSLLYCSDLSNNTIDKELLIKELSSAQTGGAKRIFNGVDIHESKGVQFAVYRNTFIASTSPIVLESSIRHLKSKTSILDNHELARILKETINRDNLLFINHQNIGKIFSGIAEWKYWGYSDFISKFSSWTTLSGKFNNTCQIYQGDFINMKGVGNYSEVFKNCAGGEMKSWKVLPYNTHVLLALPLKDFSIFSGRYREYKELYKKPNSARTEENKNWFISLETKEIATALLPFEGIQKWVTLIRTGVKERDKEGVVETFKHKGAIADLFGKVFSYTKEESYCRSGEWVIIGENKLIKEFAAGTFSDFTMEEYFSQTDLYSKISKENSLLSAIVNVSAQTDSVAALFKKSVKEPVRERLKDKNFEAIVYQLNQSESGIGLNLLFYAEQMKQLPEPERVRENKTPGWELDTIVQIDKGPFKLVNFNNGETEYLEQLSNFNLRLLDKEKKGIWTVPFQTPLRGFVVQVDYLRNKKLQMLFASGNELYLLDRKGRFAGNYPKRVDSLIMLGPKIYDIKGDGDFAIMLLHTDNTLRLYDRDCNHYPAWNNISREETIKKFPELVKVGKNKYWVLRTQLETTIYTINGNPVTKFTGKNSLMPGTEVKITSGSEVIVTTKEGRNLILNLENGKVKRMK